MALKKSELYSSLWSSCDELRGGMDASQYKDYVLVMLFIKYVSDKYAGQPYSPITIPEGASFKDMVALKGTIRHPNFLKSGLVIRHRAHINKGHCIVNGLKKFIGFFDSDGIRHDSAFVLY